MAASTTTPESACSEAHNQLRKRAVLLFCRLSNAEWCWIILAIISVWTAEALNTAFEFLTDVASPEFHPLAGKAKDVAAGAVLITAIGSVLIGLLIFGPYALALIG